MPENEQSSLEDLLWSPFKMKEVDPSNYNTSHPIHIGDPEGSREVNKKINIDNLIKTDISKSYVRSNDQKLLLVHSILSILLILK